MLRNLFTRGKVDLRGLYTDAPRPWVASYPDVPPPDGPLSSMALAARWASNDLSGEDMPEIACALLEAGLDTPTLRRLAGETEIRSNADAEPLVSRLFGELGVPYPLEEKAACLWASRQVSREVIAGVRNPWAAAKHLEIVIWGWVTENADLQAIFDINDEIDWDVAYRRSLPVLTDALIGAFARLAKIDIAGFPATPRSGNWT